MPQYHLQLLIRHELGTGVLPRNSVPRVLRGPSHGEDCDACELPVTKGQWLIEGISARKPLQLPVECFHHWEVERHIFVATTAPHIRAADEAPNG